MLVMKSSSSWVLRLIILCCVSDSNCENKWLHINTPPKLHDYTLSATAVVNQSKTIVLPNFSCCGDLYIYLNSFKLLYVKTVKSDVNKRNITEFVTDIFIVCKFLCYGDWYSLWGCFWLKRWLLPPEVVLWFTRYWW
jgi:hypothetical protein